MTGAAFLGNTASLPKLFPSHQVGTHVGSAFQADEVLSGWGGYLDSGKQKLLQQEPDRFPRLGVISAEKVIDQSSTTTGGECLKVTHNAPAMSTKSVHRLRLLRNIAVAASRELLSGQPRPIEPAMNL